MTKHIAILIGLACVGPLVADAKPKSKDKANAKVHIDRAAKAHEAGKFQVALSELETAYSIDPQPKLLYAIAQVQAKLGNCTGAIEHYEQFLATVKDKAKQEVVKQAIAACKDKGDAAAKPEHEDSPFRSKKPPLDELPTTEPPPEQKAEATVEAKTEVKPEPPPEPPPDTKPKSSPPPAPPPTPVRPAEPTPMPVAHHRSWYTDVLGDALVIGGIGAAAASYFVYASALDDLDRGEHAGSLDDYDKLVDDAHSKRTYAVILAGSGLTLIAAGILRYATRDAGDEKGVALVPTQHGGLITWSGGF